MKRYAMLGFLLLISACASSGRQISRDTVESIEVGVTTKQQLLERFGQPMTQSFAQDGQLALGWMYIHVGFGGMGGEQQMLSVLLDKDEKVARYSFTDNPAAGVRFGQ